ncbi:ABC transporter permease [Bifidobacterium simiarum]|uniref:ABC transporter permease n=1 Tax=Bifidobacterium simiarum TaxID=2045441 RepID=UPI001BDBF385|nr:ABC transporter permease [Bifidobacterium simiarum]MBT1166901.1 ABC transporter permease [Bifidobacterium simiarum]
MLSVTIQLMKRSAKMLIPAGIAVLIGTLFISCTFLFGNTLNYSMRHMLTASFGGANYAVSPDDGADYTSMHTVGDYRTDALSRIDGVKGLRVDTGLPVQVSHGGSHSTTFAFPAADNAAVMPVSLTEGSWPRHDGEIVIPADMAKRLAVKVGDSVTVDNSPVYAGSSSVGTVKEKVVGLSDDPNGAFSAYGGAGTLSERDFSVLYGTGADGYDRVPANVLYLLVEPSAGTTDQQVIDAIDRALPARMKTMSVNEFADQQMKQLNSNDTSIITSFMLAFGALSMFVAALVIGNTFQVLVAQRRRTLALLRTIGAQKGQLYRSVLTEAALLGLIASLLGVGLAFAVMGALQAFGVTMQGIRFAVVPTPEVFWVPILFGVAVTMLASLGSARLTTRVSPLEALRPIEANDTKRAGRLRLAISLIMILVGIALSAFAVWQNWQLDHDADAMIDTGATILTIAMAGGALTFLGLLLSAIRWLPAVLNLFGRLIGRCGPASTIAAANIGKNPRRVAATGTALLIGVTLVACIGTGAASAKATAATALDSRYSVDLQVTGPGLDRTVVDRVAKVKGVRSAQLVGTALAQWDRPKSAGNVSAGNASASKGSDKVIVEVVGITRDQKNQVLNASGSGFDLDANGIVMMRTMAGQTNPVADGSTVNVAFGTTNGDGAMRTTATMPLTAHLADFHFDSNYAGTALVDPAVLDRSGVAVTNQIWVKADGSVTPADLFSAVQDAVSDKTGVQVTGSVAERVQWERMIDMAMMILVALLAVAVVIALIGVANTLSLSVIERTRESATLRAIGMTRGQLRGSLAVEALLISLGSGVAGLIVGTLFGWIGSAIVFSGFGAVQYPINWGMYAMILLAGVLAALAASVLPARRAVSTPPVEALAEA